MTAREEIADIYGRVGDLFHRLAALYHETAGLPGPPGQVRVYAAPPPPVPDPHEEPDNVNATGMDGRDYYDWVMGQPAASVLRRRLQDMGKAKGWGWDLKKWTVQQVAESRQLKDAKMPSDGARRKAVR